jgi:polysaccharide pyruvyl transferase WcaK-like protein
MKMTVALVGHYGTGNLGDEAIIAAAIDNLRSRCPTAVIYGISIDPADTETRHKIAAFPVDRRTGSGASSEPAPAPPKLRAAIRGALRRRPGVRWLLSALRAMSRVPSNVLSEIRFLTRAYGRLRGTDLVVIAGSGQLSDHFGGPWLMPYNVFKWSVLARAAGAKLAFVSVGAGPLVAPLSRVFVRRALGLAHYRSFRDVGSRALMERIGAPGGKLVVPDLAHSLLIEQSALRRPADTDHLVVGINVFPHCDPRYWPVEDAMRYAAYVHKVADTVAAVIAQGDRVVLLPTQVHADPKVIEDVARALATRGALDTGRITVASCRTPEELTRELEGCDLVIATRFHGVVMALLSNKPVIAISNHPKTSDLMADAGLSAYALDIDAWDAASLMARLSALRAEADDVKRRIAARVRQHRAVLDRQYDAVLALVDRRHGDTPLTTPLTDHIRWSRTG